MITTHSSALPADQLAALSATEQLAAWSSRLDASMTPAAILDRLRLVLIDTFGVTLAGARLPERAALVAAWAPATGPCPLVGTGLSTVADTAAWLNATALVSLELDEGNKFARGHPAAHGFPAVLALAAERDSDGPTTAAALLAAYEVAARFGRATTLHAGLHPHGNWGVTGAAAGCARLLGLDAGTTAAAIDTAAGLAIAGPFAAAMDGNPVRNEWMGAANTAGLAAVRLAQAGVARATGLAARSLGEQLGSFDAATLVDSLDTRWDIELGYFKRHSSCAFTHPAADAALLLRDVVDPDQIERIEVATYSAAATLDRIGPTTRLAAMFSIPFVVATALVDGVVRPSSYEGGRLEDGPVSRLAARVRVDGSAEIDARLPDHRGAVVRAVLTDGTVITRAVDDPIGDAAWQPFDEVGLTDLLAGLLGDAGDVRAVTAVAGELLDSRSARSVLARLATL